MADQDWEHYEISLSPKKPPAPRPPQPAPEVRALPGDRPLASRGDRLVAYLLDFFASLLSVAAGFGVAAALGGSSSETYFRLALGAWGALGVGQLVLLSLRGQTLGKMVV